MHYRYILALVFTMVLPPVLMFWMVVHPFIGFWRKLGLRWTYGILVAAMGAGAAVLFHFRRPLLAVDFGENRALQAAGGVCVALSLILRVMVGRKFSMAQIIGVPEIAPQEHPGKLMTAGIYAHIRHPRYVQLFLGLAGGALVANHLASYVATALWLPGIWIIVGLEEKELCKRFGAAYEDYRRRVPGFIPRMRL
jgi:protein-S-isoprenylcysteine O-methyltransferase Ste14